MIRIIADTRPLRESPAFRRLWVGSVLSGTGGQLTNFAVVLQVYTLTHSSLAVGGVGLAASLPAIAFGLFGGSIADAVDRRKLVLLTSSLLALVSAGFALQAFAELRELGLLYALLVVQSLLSAVNSPARQTFLPRLLSPERLPAGAALNMLAMHMSVVGGPALGGVLAAAGGLKLCYLIDALSFGAALYGVARLPAMPPIDAGTARPSLWAVGEALGFIRRSRVITGAFLADLNATVLGMPFALFPAINAHYFGGAPQTLGLLSAAPAVGGILGSALSGPIAKVSRHGRAMLIAGSVWGLSLAGFGLSQVLWLAFGLLVVAGMADVISVVFRTTIVQVATPDRFRGRVGAAEYVVGAACPQLGNFRAGLVGSLTTPAVGVISGGLATVVGSVVIGLALPAFTQYRAASHGRRQPVAGRHEGRRPS